MAQTNDGAEAKTISPSGDGVIHSRLVIGADGMHSIVRQAAGIEFDGDVYEESFVLADVKIEGNFNRDEVGLFLSPDGLMVVAPLPNGDFRIVAALADAPEKPMISDVQAIIDGRGPSARCVVKEVAWGSRFRLHHRVARSYREGPFLLMGDAAHVHSPAGGQGMNTGLVDAVVLSRLLNGVIAEAQPEAALDRYEALRRPAAQEVLSLAGRLTTIATMKGGPRTRLRNSVLSLADHLPPVKHRLEMNLSGLNRKQFTKLAA